MFNLVLLIATGLAGIAVTAYWFVQQCRPPLYTVMLFMSGVALVAGSTLFEQISYSYAPPATPIAIAIAFDLSPSMLAIPDPQSHPDIAPRYAKARDTLLEVLRSMEERQQNIIVSLIGFTSDAEVLMGWDYSVMQLREILQYSLSPNLFTSSGTRMEAAVETLVDVFEMLPSDLNDRSRKIAIIVSDGEDTTSDQYLAYALDELGSSSFDVISLQTGLLGVSEGVPRYGQVGEFLGFEIMSGNAYSTPDIEVMHAIAQASPQRGLYVRAEESDAVEQVLSFTNDGQFQNQNLSGQLMLTLSLLAVVALLFARILQ